MFKLTIKKVQVFTLAKVQAVIFWVLGILNAAFYTLMLVLGQSVNTGKLGGTIDKLGLAVLLMFILIPIFYAILGFAAGIVLAVTYNLVAKFLGGVKIQGEVDKTMVMK